MASILVLLSDPSDQPVTVNYAITGGTATAGSDYSAPASGTLTFAPGVTSLAIPIGIINDTTDEPDETVVLALSNPAGAALGNTPGTTLTIRDDDVTGTGATISASAGTPFSGVVASFTDVAPNSDGGQYTASINWGDGHTSAGSVVANGQGGFNVLGSNTFASAGNFNVGVTVNSVAVGGSTPIASSAVVSPPPPALSVSSVAQAEGNSGTTPFTFTVSLSGATSQTVTANYATVDGTATTADNDYQAASGTLTFAPGETSKSVTVNVVGDTRAEPNETFTLAVSGATSTANPTAQGTGTIVNDDPVITNPGSMTSAEGAVVSVPIQASDPAGAQLYFGSANLPAGLTIDSQTGVISGTLAYSDAETAGGNYAVTVNAYDTLGGVASQTFNWAVTNTNTPPVLNNPGDQTSAENDGVALQLTVTQPDGDPLTYGASGLPGGLSINTTTGLITGAVSSTAAAHGPYNVTVTASDGVSTSSQSFAWDVQRIRIDYPGAPSNLEGDSVNVPIQAWDPTGAALAYSATGLPQGLGIDPASGVISGTVATGAASANPYNVTVTASDGTSSASASFPWAVGSVAVDNPGDQTNAEGDAVSLPMSAALSDGQPPAWSASGLPAGLGIDTSSGVISGTVASLDANNGPYAVTVTASDGARSASESFNWTITHVLLTDPGEQISAQGSSASLQMQASDPDGDPLTFAATGLPAGVSINAATGLISGTVSGSAGAGSPYAVTVTASDGAHTAADTFSWLVSNGQVTVSSPGTQTSAEGAGVSLQVSAGDPADDTMTYDAVGLPAGVQIDPASGLISGTVDYGAADVGGGAYQATVFADNGQGGTGSQTFTWNVTNTDQAPSLDNPGDQANVIGDAVSLPALAGDPDGDAVTFGASGLPAGLSIAASTGVISGTVSGTASLSNTVTITASDGTLTDSQTFLWAVTDGSVTVTAPNDQANVEGDAVSLQVAATNPAGLPLTYTASGLPAGLGVNAGSGLISGTVAGTAGETSGGSYEVTLTATDSQGHGGAAQFLWSVSHVDQAPALTNPGGQTAAEGGQVSLQVQASDPEGDPLTYAANGLPAGLSLDEATGLITGQVDYTAAETAGGHYTARVAVNDGYGHTVSQSFSWAVTDAVPPPWVADPGPQYNEAGDAVSVQMYGGGNDGGAVTFGASGLPAGVSIDPATGLISGTIGGGAAGSYTPTVTVSEGQSQASRQLSWQVSSGRVPEVLITLVGANTPWDDVALMGPSAQVQAQVTLLNATPGLHDVELSVPSARSSVDRPSLTLASGGAATVAITPLLASAAADDVLVVARADGQAAGGKDVTNLKVEIRHVSAEDTPKGMKDRIPPGKNATNFYVKLSADLSDTDQWVFVSVQGQSDANGRAVLVGRNNDAGALQLQDSAVARVKGTAQTAPTADGKGGNAGKLTVVTGDLGKKASSPGFSVAAIPIAVRMYNPTKYSGADASEPDDAKFDFRWGVKWDQQYITDSDPSGATETKDLDQVEARELIKAQKATNSAEAFFANSKVGTWDGIGKDDLFIDETAINIQTDKMVNGKPIDSAVTRSKAAKYIQNIITTKGNGTGGALQSFQFIEKRTGYTNKDKPLTVAESGFRIHFAIEKDGAKYLVKIKRTAEANNGAGKGRITASDTAEVPDEIK